MARRIFWLGAHKILKTTELKYLRALGYEVFNPPYVSSIYDQSADLSIDYDQPTSLPSEVLTKLLHCNFFYTTLPKDVVELLNIYFDAVIVTINGDWLKSIIDTFNGKIIYRLYGQPYSLSDYLVSLNLWPHIIERGNLHIVPFCWESIEREHRWFRDLCPYAVPYQISDDVFEYSELWQRTVHTREISCSIPNIQNPYYATTYAQFSLNFQQDFFRIYGPQRSAPDDPRIVGYLKRDNFLQRLSSSSGYFYPYDDWVCYLPPIEMMVLGGPVLYAPGSLLARMYDGKTPGLASDVPEAERKCDALLSGDRIFINEVIAAQEDVRNRYDRRFVRPAFEHVFLKLLGPPGITALLPSHTPAAVAISHELDHTTSKICILLHIDGLFGRSGGVVNAFEGIPRVVDIIVNSIMEYGDFHVMLTCTRASAPLLHDFFHNFIRSGRLSLKTVLCGSGFEDIQSFRNRLSFVKELNESPDAMTVLVPHYYLFPESLLMEKDLVLYLPDYFPHLMKNVIFDGTVEKDQENKEVGVAIARKAKHILTNSSYTKQYLPDAGFVSSTETDKIVVAPIPLLGAHRHQSSISEEQKDIQDRLADRPFIFYPTANRPNKKLAFLLEVFAELRKSDPLLALVLTGDLETVPGVSAVADAENLRDHLIMLGRIDEFSLKWLYQNACALCLTSIVEGNFPPQILEALYYGTPVVATRLPTITEILNDRSDDLLLCAPLSKDDFCAKLRIAISQRGNVLERQVEIMEFLAKNNSKEEFYKKFCGIL